MLVSNCQRLVTWSCTARRTRHTPHYTLHATDCIGPSLYAARQGRPVKVWGLLYKGHLCIHVLPEDVSTKNGSAHINQGRYQKMIRLHAKRWLRVFNEGRLPHRAQLVHDHGKCLWASCSLEVCRSNHFHPIMGGAVRPLNILGKDMLVDMCRGFQKRCREVIQRRGRRIDYWVSSSRGFIANGLCLKSTSSDPFRLRASASKDVLFA